jgi:hypothetical protein
MPSFVYSEDAIDSKISPQLILDNYNNAECCLLVDQLEIVKLRKRKKVELNLYDYEHLLELSTGPTFSALIEVPESEKIEKYEIETNVIHVGKELFVFFPYVATLDSDFNLIGTTDFTNNHYSGKSLFQSSGLLSLTFNIDPNFGNHKAVRYFLIYTRKKHFTTKKLDQLKTISRDVKLKEVSLKYADSVAEYVERDTLYGLPGGKIVVINKGLIF